MTRRLLGAGRVAEVFEDGEAVLKLYAPGTGLEHCRREAMVLDAIRDIPLRIPASLGIVEIDGRLGLRMSRIAGTPLGAGGDAALFPGLLDTLASLQLKVLANTVHGLPRLKQRLRDRIMAAPALADPERSRLLDRLAELPDGDSLCHGDFHPLNIIADGDDLGIVDWLDASSGPPEADIARTWLLVRLHMPEAAELYLDAIVRQGGPDHAAILAWLPLVAAARLAENVVDESGRLLDMSRLA